MSRSGNRPSRQDRALGLLQASEGVGVGRDLPTRSLIFDCVLAVVFFGCGSVFLPLFFQAFRPIDAIFVGLVNLPLMIRRRLPRVSFGLCQVFGLLQIWWPSPIGLHDGGLLFSLYSLVGFTNRRTGVVGLLVLLVLAFSGSVNDWWGFVDDQLSHIGGGEPGLLTRIATTAGMIVLVIAAWASGERLRSARIGQVALADRADQLERDRDQQSRLAAAAERARIAREMHDVIAHALSVMIAQADGAAYVIDSSPETAKTALERISSTGRDSLTQMRGLLGLLREGSDAGADDRADAPGRTAVPQPGVEQLPQLIDDARSTGLQVSFEQHGQVDQVAEMPGLTIYRLLQESLTNARKHGGDRVDVKIDFDADQVRLRVINNTPTGGKRLQTGEPGHGLLGMRERVGAVGGRVTAGPTADGFAVQAWIPLLPATVAGNSHHLRTQPGTDPAAAASAEGDDDDQGLSGR